MVRAPTLNRTPTVAIRDVEECGRPDPRRSSTGPASTRAIYDVEPGTALPQGATPDREGVNFSLFSENATGVKLLLFERHDDAGPFQTVAFDPQVNKTFHFWHVFIRGLPPETHYAYRVDGPQKPKDAQRFDREKVFIDPYAEGNTNSLWQRASACVAGDNLATSMRSAVIAPAGYDWEGDLPLGRPMEDTIIYELHMRGFSKSPSSGVAHPGTFSAITDKIPYLRQLGVTAVELMPVCDFDETDVLWIFGDQPLRKAGAVRVAAPGQREMVGEDPLLSGAVGRALHLCGCAEPENAE